MKGYIVIVGCGIAGSVLARRFAEEKNSVVLVIERKNYLGGYCNDFRDESGILIHRHGPHIFRTNSKNVWDYLSRFTKWEDYQHKVLSYVDGHFYPMPINLDTINSFLGTHYTAETVDEYFNAKRTKPNRILNVKDAVESQIGREFFQAFFENYTEKQWGISCEKLPPEIISRIPIRKNRDSRYFTARYQALPQKGYTKMIENMLDHPNIHILLNTDYADVREQVRCDHVYYSGSIDEYFGYRYGKLPYRSVTFQFEKYNIREYQPTSVVNYPNNYDYTRITEFKHFYRNSVMQTVIAKEIPGFNGDPSYPIPLTENISLYNKYASIADNSVTFIGRLGEYKYYSIDQIIEKILSMEI